MFLQWYECETNLTLDTVFIYLQEKLEQHTLKGNDDFLHDLLVLIMMWFIVWLFIKINYRNYFKLIINIVNKYFEKYICYKLYPLI